MPALSVRDADQSGRTPSQTLMGSLAGARSLIDELEAATNEASQERRVAMLRHVTDLFIGSANNFTHEHVDVFDNVLGHLIQRVEHSVLAELGTKLAPVGNAPKKIIQNLAQHDEIKVAGPVLTQSTQLSDHVLAEIAKTKSQDHLGAISERKHIAATVTDIMVERGNTGVVHKLSRNHGANFSEFGFATMTNRATNDDALAENLVRRVDVPQQMLSELVTRATETVRARLLAAATPENEGAIRNALATASVKVMAEAVTPRDFSDAEALVAKLAKNNELNEATVLAFAMAEKYEETVAALALMCSAPVKLIDQLMCQPRHDGILVACKAAGLHWQTFNAILNKRLPDQQLTVAEIERARSDFVKLSAKTAIRAFHFWVIRGVTKPQLTEVQT